MEVMNSTEFQEPNVLIGQVGKTKNFGVSDDPMLMSMLSTGLYANPLRTMIQEIMFNAWDNAPNNIMTVFEELYVTSDTKSAIAVRHNTSTRTIGRWMDKYDFDSYILSKELTMTIGERAQFLFNNWITDRTEAALAALVEFKKLKKKSWNALGFKPKQQSQIESAMN